MLTNFGSGHNRQLHAAFPGVLQPPADAKLKLDSTEGLLTGKHCDLVILNQMLSQREAELLNANQKVAQQAEKLDMLTQQQCTLSVSKPVAQSQSREVAAVSPVKDMQVCG